MLIKLFLKLFEHVVRVLKHSKLTPAIVKYLEHSLLVSVIFSAETPELVCARFDAVVLIGREFKTIAKVAYTLGSVIDQ